MAVAVTIVALLSAACASSSSGASVASVSTAHTFEIDTTWTGGGPKVTERRIVDNDRHLREIFPSSDEGGGSTPDEIDDGDTAYVTLAEANCSGPSVSGKMWQRQTLPRASAAEARMTDPFDYPLTTASPAQALAELSPIVTAIRPAGRATIDGVSTSKFLLTVSSAQMQLLMAGGQTIGPVDPAVHFAVAMWVDTSNRLRQSWTTVTAPGQATEIVTNRYSHFGAPVNITIPPASEVVQKCD